jgi:hypothetical protein
MMGQDALSQYGAVERRGVRHWYGRIAPGSCLMMDGMDTLAEVALIMVFVLTL